MQLERSSGRNIEPITSEARYSILTHTHMQTSDTGAYVGHAMDSQVAYSINMWHMHTRIKRNHMPHVANKLPCVTTQPSMRQIYAC